MTFTIYSRKLNDKDVSPTCLATLVQATATHILFETEKWLPNAIDLHYYAKRNTLEESQALYRIHFDEDASVKPPYRYKASIEEKYKDIGPEGADDPKTEQDESETSS